MSGREPVLVALVLELCSELEAEITARFVDTLDHQVMRRRFDRDMEPVRRARKFVRDAGLDHHAVMFVDLKKDPQ